MCAWQPETHSWPDRHAVLFVHGVGNSKPGDYDSLIARFKSAVGSEIASRLAVYFLYYDDMNDWMAEKVRLAEGINSIRDWLHLRLLEKVGGNLGQAIAEFAGDVLFPVLNEASRLMIRERYLAQIKQMRLDGNSSGVPFRRQNISIICHSLGCFHTYEMLHAAAGRPEHRLLPVTDAMQFSNVIFMASPVQLIRAVAQQLGPIVSRRELASVAGDTLTIPAQQDPVTQTAVPSVKHWAAVTGDFDPVGGFLLGRKLEWAYMQLSGQDSIVDAQSVLNISGEDDLATRLTADREKGAGPALPLSNPHSWDGYITQNKEDLIKWLSV